MFFFLPVVCLLWECHNVRWDYRWSWGSCPCKCVSLLHVVGVASILEGSDFMFDCVDERARSKRGKV